MSSHAEPYPTAIGLRALHAAVAAHRAASRPAAGPGLLWRGRRRAGPGPGVAAAAVPLQREPADAAGRPGAGGEVDAVGPAEFDPAAGPGGPAGPDGETWALVRAAQAGDAEAFGRLYDRYVGLVYRYAYHRLGDRPQAEDVTSETFLRALRRIGTLQYQGRDIGAWFVTIARNLVLDHRKSGRARLEVATAELPEYDAGDRPEAAVLTRIANASLLECVRRLNPEQQECVVLRFLNGMSVAETAEIMGKNEGAIKALQHRAIRRLAALLPEDPR
jgi:RNA polymerase sigma-70 factor (TIGR02952 family)